MKVSSVRLATVIYTRSTEGKPLKTSVGFAKLASITESTLRQLGYEFAVNRASQIVEFEVMRPEQFIVRITHLKEVEYPSAVFGFALPGRQSECNDFRLVFTGDARGARELSAKLVKGILSSMKKPPWKGLGLVESMTSKSMWLRAAEGLD